MIDTGDDFVFDNFFLGLKIDRENLTAETRRPKTRYATIRILVALPRHSKPNPEHGMCARQQRANIWHRQTIAVVHNEDKLIVKINPRSHR